MEKRSLLSEMFQSEVNATLEHLSRCGVTAEGLKFLRGKTPGAFGKQLAAFLNAGSFYSEVALSSFPTFSVTISEKVENLYRKKEYDCFIDTGVGCAYPHQLDKVLPSVEFGTFDFIVLNSSDFFKFYGIPYREFLSDEWLGDWSDTNLVGGIVQLCPQGIAPYLIPFCRDYMSQDFQEVHVATESNARCPIVIDIKKRASNYYLAGINKFENTCPGGDYILRCIRKKI